MSWFLFFFFQAEDGIRDLIVTGVQTCALPIYPVRLPLDVVLVFSANPEDYTARGKIVTPLKDRIGSEIKTHYPGTLEHGLAITEQEAWIRRNSERKILVPHFIKQIVEAIAFKARADQRIDKRSGVSQRLPISCLENVLSNAERRSLIT